MLEIDKIYSDTKIIVYVKGRLDSLTAQQLSDFLADETFDDIEINCAELVYISSAGLRVLLQTRKAYPTLCLTHVKQAVYEIISITGFIEFFHITDIDT